MRAPISKAVLTILAAGFVTAAVSDAQAGLEFEKDHIEVKADPADDKIPVQFKFKVTGEETVTIKEIQSSCGCLSAKTDKMSYGPGDSGVVDSVFTVGSLEGRHNKSMWVINSDPKTETDSPEGDNRGSQALRDRAVLCRSGRSVRNPRRRR